ncbi:hypothetical protein [uncultured Thiocystis sp.]|jgi:hypothetical protein|uniref:hypothetical protein n=1 Tax=uncultured Thiocystis sp. TaxID=1202134 RepID=UPI0025F404B6|nr:hypothetical protein [uncultured Thiocystis sp.]
MTFIPTMQQNKLVLDALKLIAAGRHSALSEVDEIRLEQHMADLALISGPDVLRIITAPPNSDRVRHLV